MAQPPITSQMLVGTAPASRLASGGSGCMLVINLGTTDVYLGNSNVTPSTGILLLGQRGMPIKLSLCQDWYAITASGQANLAIALGDCKSFFLERPAPAASGGQTGPRPSVSRWYYVTMNSGTAAISFTGIGAGSFTSAGVGAQTLGYKASTLSDSQQYTSENSAPNNHNASIFNDTSLRVELNNFKYLEWRVAYTPNTNVRIFAGLMDAADGGTSGNLQGDTPPAFAGPPNNMVCFRFSTSADAGWAMYTTQTGGAFTVVQTGASVDGSGTSHLYSIEQTVAGTFVFSIDGVAIGSMSTTLPLGTVKMSFFVYLEALSAQIVRLGWVDSYWENIK